MWAETHKTTCSCVSAALPELETLEIGKKRRKKKKEQVLILFFLDR